MPTQMSSTNLHRDPIVVERIRTAARSNMQFVTSQTHSLYAPRIRALKPQELINFRYLFCLIPKSETEAPYCMSKVKMGGDCTGLEKYPVCYGGICRETANVESRCHPVPKDQQQESPIKAKESEKFNPLKEHLLKKNKLPEAMWNKSSKSKQLVFVVVCVCLLFASVIALHWNWIDNGLSGSFCARQRPSWGSERVVEARFE